MPPPVKAKSPDWPSSVFFLTYDEHGGYYDHVAPPPAPIPDGIPSMLSPADVPAAFDHYGVRVPFVVMSPFSKPHFVSHRVSDHTSILAFIERTVRARSAHPARREGERSARLLRLRAPDLPQAPRLPAATIDPTKAAQCAAIQPGVLGA